MTVATIAPPYWRQGTVVSVICHRVRLCLRHGSELPEWNGAASPTASNVQVDSSRITATVTVPKRKNLGRDPEWDVHVGSEILVISLTVCLTRLPARGGKARESRKLRGPPFAGPWSNRRSFL